MRRWIIWLTMLTGWGVTWLSISMLALGFGWTAAADFASEGALVAFALTLMTAMWAAVLDVGRWVVERRLRAAGTAWTPPAL